MPRPIAWPAFACFALLVAATPARAQDTAAMSAIAKSRPQVQQPKLKPERSPAVKSAQGDCVREANRRGFAVMDTSNYQQSREGWSLDLQVRDMRGRESRGTCFVETGSGEVSLSGFRWGYEDEGDDRIEFSCASTDSRYRECQLPIDGRARLVKRRSDAPCIEGRTWGQRGDRVWVDQGCRARFEVQRAVRAAVSPSIAVRRTASIASARSGPATSAGSPANTATTAAARTRRGARATV